MTTNLIVAACKLSYVCENKLLESSMVYTGKAIENTSVKYRERIHRNSTVSLVLQKAPGKAFTSRWELTMNFPVLNACRFIWFTANTLRIGRSETELDDRKEMDTEQYGYCMAPLGARKFLHYFYVFLWNSPCSETLQNHSKQQKPLKIPWFSLNSTKFH